MARISDLKTLQLVQAAPNVQILPKNPKELADQKSAELCDSVWQHFFETHDLKLKFNDLYKDLIELGEMCMLIKWNTNKMQKIVRNNSGLIHEKNYEGDPYYQYSTESMDRGLPHPRMQTGGPQPMNKDKINSIFLGGFDFQRIFPTNLLRPAQNPDIKDCPWLAVTSLVPQEFLYHKFGVKIPGNHYLDYGVLEHDFFVFQEDAFTPYSHINNKVRITEIFWRPAPWIPFGWYVVHHHDQILYASELPFGIFPIVYAGYRTSQTSARSHSLLQDLKPFQRQINRCITEAIRHQMSIGSDRLLIDKGAKVTDSSIVAGVQMIKYDGVLGEKPTYLEGRSGEQFYKTLINQINQMYAVANLKFEMVESGVRRQDKTIKDPQAMIYEDMKQKQDNGTYADKVEKFVEHVCKTTLKMARFYLPDEMVIPIVGKREQVNLAEFRTKEDIDQVISIKPRSDDATSVMGKQLAMAQVMQYGGNVLPPEAIGSIVQNMPFLNHEQIMASITIDYETQKNMILALDRGEMWQADQNDNIPIMIDALTLRMRQSDFRFLNPQSQMMHQMTLQKYQQMMQMKQEQIKRDNAGLIPTGGPGVKVQHYVPYKKKNGEMAQRNLIIPVDALEWMLERLEAQKWNPQNQIAAQEETLNQARQQIRIAS